MGSYTILFLFAIPLVVLGIDHLNKFREKYYRKHHNNSNYTSEAKLSHEDHHWKSLLEIDGLQNEQIVFAVTSTTPLIRERIIPSSRTWMRMLKQVFVIVEDNVDTRFLLRHCELTEFPLHSSFQCDHHEPRYVLSRNCTNDYYVAKGICCKADEAMQFVILAETLYPNMKYFFMSDDDTFFRVDEVMRWLSLLDKSPAADLPIIGGVDTGMEPSDDNNKPHGVWHITGCEEIHVHGSYQPVMFNKISLNLLRDSVMKHGFTSTCRAFDLSQDQAFGIFGWIFQLNHVRLPQLSHREVYSELHPDDVIVHHIRPKSNVDDCRGDTWSKEMRYNQKLLIGCGDIGHPNPMHDVNNGIDMYDVWSYFAEFGIPLKLIDETWLEKIQRGYFYIDDNLNTVPAVMILGGYNTTRHSKEFNVADKWKPFTMKDCNNPGTVNGLTETDQPFNKPDW